MSLFGSQLGLNDLMGNNPSSNVSTLDTYSYDPSNPSNDAAYAPPADSGTGSNTGGGGLNVIETALNDAAVAFGASQGAPVSIKQGTTMLGSKTALPAASTANLYKMAIIVVAIIAIGTIGFFMFRRGG